MAVIKEVPFGMTSALVMDTGEVGFSQNAQLLMALVSFCGFVLKIMDPSSFGSAGEFAPLKLMPQL